VVFLKNDSLNVFPADITEHLQTKP